VDGEGSKWTVIRLKIDGLDESKDRRMVPSVKVGGPRILKSESGRS